MSFFRFCGPWVGDIHSINTATGQQAFLFLKEMEQEGSFKSAEYFPYDGRSDESVYKGKDRNDVPIPLWQSTVSVRGNPDLEFGVAAIPCGNPQVTGGRRRDSGGGR